MRHGKGTYIWNDGTRYEGDFKNGFRNGKGIIVYKSGDTFSGEF